MTSFIAIAIVAANGVLGDGEKQPFEFAEDWARYKRVTLGHPMIMGRRTHDAIGRFLPGRTTIIVTRRPETVEIPDGVDAYAVASVDAALDLAAVSYTHLDVYKRQGLTVARAVWDQLPNEDIVYLGDTARAPYGLSLIHI